MSTKVKKKHANRPIKTSIWMLLPIILMLGFVPLIVKEHVYETNLSGFAWFGSMSEYTDFFLYYKSMAIIMLGTVMASIVVYRLVKEKKQIRFTVIMLPLFIYGILAFLSSVFSEYASFAMSGGFEQFESVWVLLSYCIIAYYTFLNIQSEEDIKVILKWFFIGTAIIVFIGISQALKLDFYRTAVGKMLITSGRTAEELKGLEFNFDLGRTYMSLYNPNYVGTYVPLLLPLFTVLAIFTKNFKWKAAYGIIVFLLVVCLVCSWSSAGIVALCTAMAALLVFFKDYYKKYWKILAAGAAVILIGIVVFDQMNQNIFSRKFANIFAKTATEDYLSKIETNDDNIIVTYEGNDLVVQFDLDAEDEPFTFSDRNGSVFNYETDGEGVSRLQDERFTDLAFYVVRLEEGYGFGMNVKDEPWYFTNETSDDSYYLYNKYGKLDKINTPESMLFDGMEHFATDRGYIWSRTLPLLKQSMILGSGADSFIFRFPNDDYVGNANFVYMKGVMTKPHCMYLQIAVQTGVLSLLAFLAFYFMYFVSSAKLYWKIGFKSYLSQIGIGILAGTVGYMVAGTINDSTITVAPIYFALVGIGLAVNWLLKKEAEAWV